MKKTVKRISFLLAAVLAMGILGCNGIANIETEENGGFVAEGNSEQVDIVGTESLASEEAQLGETVEEEVISAKENSQPEIMVYSENCPTGAPIEPTYATNELPAMVPESIPHCWIMTDTIKSILVI